MNRIDIKSILNFDHLNNDVQKHLKNVYSTLSLGIVAAAVGSYIHVNNIFQGGLLAVIFSLGFLGAILLTEHNRKNVTLRMGCFLGFGFCTGLSLGPLINVVASVDQTILPTALLSTSVVFLSLTLSALLTQSRVFLYMGGMLLSALNVLLLMNLVNIFVGSRMLMSVDLYLGLGIFCLFVLFDTQLIVAKRQRGDDDFIW